LLIQPTICHTSSKSTGYVFTSIGKNSSSTGSGPVTDDIGQENKPGPVQGIPVQQLSIINNKLLLALMNWMDEFQGAITICDRKGIVVYMNDLSKKQFAKYDENGLIGKSLLNCHPEPAKSKLKKMLAEPTTNSYTIEKNGIRKMIHQTPWIEGGEFKGVVELSFVIPSELPHHKRN
jgi:transcriptional regulator with PAS, ATPase and Fis domain